MSGYIDLHIHSTASDGSFRPAELVQQALLLNLEAISLTDHDTVSGYTEAAEAAQGTVLQVIPGIEISTRFRRAVHLLGYGFEPASPVLREVLDWIVDDRDLRNEKICALMRKDGLPVTYPEMKQRFGEIVGRPHFAQLLLEFGLADSVEDAFHRYLEKGCRYYQLRNFLSFETSVETIRKAGGLPVLAHPFQYRLDDAGLRELIRHGLDYGLCGLECRYSGYTEEQCVYLLRLSEEYRLIPTGGSDFHGSSKPEITLGDANVPSAYLDPIRNQSLS